MPSDSSSHPGRRHFHRGRRGHDRRSGDRRHTPPQGQPAESSRGGDHVDVESIMRDIRRSIAQRHGVELTDQQVQELAARRLESILDPRTIKPSLLEQLRKRAGTTPPSVAEADRATKPYEFEDNTLYESPNAFVRAIRRLLNPILKLFFNPNPLIQALHIQARLNVEASRRDAERDRQQAEWNALHYELLLRMVQETAKVSLELQSLSLRVESLSTKVDFSERRVREIEGAVHQVRPGRDRERDRDRDRDRDAAVPTVQAPPAVDAPAPASAQAPAAEAAGGETQRRRRRRRRGRRGGGGIEAVPPGAGAPQAADVDAGGDVAEGEGDVDVIEAGELEPGEGPDIVTPGVEAIIEDERDIQAEAERLAAMPPAPDPYEPATPTEIETQPEPPERAPGAFDAVPSAPLDAGPPAAPEPDRDEPQ